MKCKCRENRPLADADYSSHYQSASQHLRLITNYVPLSCSRCGATVNCSCGFTKCKCLRWCKGSFVLDKDIPNYRGPEKAWWKQERSVIGCTATSPSGCRKWTAWLTREQSTSRMFNFCVNRTHAKIEWGTICCRCWPFFQNYHTKIGHRLEKGTRSVLKNDRVVKTKTGSIVPRASLVPNTAQDTVWGKEKINP
jgi:hypothetical protein